jgi:hypothetical protein
MSGHLTREEKDKWKEDVINSRHDDFKELVKWLGEKGINFKETMYGVELNLFDISNTLQVNFPGSRKKYQYNLEGIKERLIKDFKI